VENHVKGPENKGAPYRPGNPVFWPRGRSRGNNRRESFDYRIPIHPIVHSAPSPPLCPIRHSMIHPILNHPTRADFAPTGWRRTPTRAKSIRPENQTPTISGPSKSAGKISPPSKCTNASILSPLQGKFQQCGRARGGSTRDLRRPRQTPKTQSPKAAKPQKPNPKTPKPQNPIAHRTPKISPAPIPCGRSCTRSCGRRRQGAPVEVSHTKHRPRCPRCNEAL
jgi:hypothetical protein